MAKFNLTAQLNIQAPTNLQSVVNQINSQLKGVNVDLNINLSQAGTAELNKLNQAVNGVSKSASSAKDEMFKFGQASAESIKRFAGISVASSIFYRLVGSIRSSIKEAIDFQDEMVKISQVTGQSLSNLSGLEKQVTSLATSLGVSSRKLIDVAQILAQAGLSAKDTQTALATLAKTDLAATFTDIKNTTEGAVAAMAQFGRSAENLDEIMGSINQVSAKFAVEASDLVTVIRRAGGAFKTAGGDLNELLALFTAVRSTTRESAESISTGFRTIFTRIQRNRTVEFLKELGVELRDVEGRFVGPYQAVERLSAALNKLEGTDPRVNAIIEELGGFRQVEKVIPLLQQFAKAQQALSVAQMGSASLAEDAAVRQQSYAIQIQKLNEEFQSLIRTVANNSEVKAFAQLMLSLATEAVKLTKALEPLIPLIGAFAAYKVGTALGPFAKGFAQNIKFNTGGKVPRKFADGGFVPGHGDGDTVPAMLTPGEFVIRKSSVKKIGVDKLHAMNRKYAGGGYIEDRIPALLTPGEYVFGKSAAQRIGYGNLRRMNVAGYKDGDVVQTKLKSRAQKIYEDYPKDVQEKNVRQTSILTEREKAKARAGEAKWVINQKFSALVPNNRGGAKLETLGFRNIPSVPIAEAIRQGAKAEAFDGQTTGQVATPGFNVYGTDSKAPEKLTAKMFDIFINTVNRYRKVLKLQNIGNENQLFDVSARDTIKGIAFESFMRGLGSDLLSGKSESSTNFDFQSSNDVLKSLFGDFAPPADAKANKPERFDDLKGSLVKKAINEGFKPVKRAAGGIIPGFGNGDTVPAMLTPGEYVIRKQAVEAFGVGNLNKINRFAGGGLVQQFKAGDKVQTGGGFGVGATIATVLPSLIFQMQATGTQFEGISKTLNSTIIQFTAFKAILSSATEVARENKRVKAEELKESIKVKREAAAKISPDAYSASGRLQLGKIRPGYQEEIAAARASIAKDQARLSKLERTSSGRVAMGLNVAGNLGLLATSFATTYGEERKQKAMSRLQEGDVGAVGEYTTGANIAGFGSRIGTGAVAGATIGSFFAPGIGTAIGAAAGAIIGAGVAAYEMEKATKEAEEALQKFAASKVFNSLEAKFKEISQTPTSVRFLSGSISADLKRLTQQFAETAPDSEARKSIRADIKNQLVEVDNFLRTLAQSSSTVEEFAAASLEARNFLFQFSNLKFDEINKKYLSQIGLMDRHNKTISAITQAEALYFIRTQALNNTLATFQDSIESASTTLSSYFGRETRRTEKLQQGIGLVQSVTGTNQIIDTITRDILTASTIRSIAPSILLNAVQAQPLGTDQTGLIDGIVEGFRRSGISEASLSAIRKQLEQLKGPTENESVLRQRILENPQEVGTKIFEEIDGFTKAFGELLKIIEQNNSELKARWQQNVEIQGQMTDALAASVNIEEQRARFIAKARINAGMSAQEDFSEFPTRIQRGRLTQAAALSRQAYNENFINNPELVGGGVTAARRERQRLESAVGQQTDNRTIQEMNRNIEQLRGAEKEYIAVLKDMTNATANSADAMNRYEKFVNERRAKQNIAEKIARGGPSAVQELRVTEDLIKRIQTLGIGAVGGAGSQGINMVLDQLRELPDEFRINGQTVGELRKSINQQALAQFGYNPNVLEPSSEELEAQNEILQAYDLAAEASRYLAEVFAKESEDLIASINANTAAQNQRFKQGEQDLLRQAQIQKENQARAEQEKQRRRETLYGGAAAAVSPAFNLSGYAPISANDARLTSLISRQAEISSLSAEKARLEKIKTSTAYREDLSNVAQPYGQVTSINPEQLQSIINDLAQRSGNLDLVNSQFFKTEALGLRTEAGMYNFKQVIQSLENAIGRYTQQADIDRRTLQTNINSFAQSIGEDPNQTFIARLLSEQIAKAFALAVERIKSETFASGGLVGNASAYLALGGSASIFKPKGTDTVPAMLTPGEFVVRKSAVDRVGVSALESINKGVGSIYRANGGVVYAQNGVYVPEIRSKRREFESNGQSTFRTQTIDEEKQKNALEITDPVERERVLREEAVIGYEGGESESTVGRFLGLSGAAERNKEKEQRNQWWVNDQYGWSQIPEFTDANGQKKSAKDIVDWYYRSLGDSAKKLRIDPTGNEFSTIKQQWLEAQSKYKTSEQTRYDLVNPYKYSVSGGKTASDSENLVDLPTYSRYQQSKRDKLEAANKSTERRTDTQSGVATRLLAPFYEFGQEMTLPKGMMVPKVGKGTDDVKANQLFLDKYVGSKEHAVETIKTTAAIASLLPGVGPTGAAVTKLGSFIPALTSSALIAAGNAVDIIGGTLGYGGETLTEAEIEKKKQQNLVETAAPILGQAVGMAGSKAIGYGFGKASKGLDRVFGTFDEVTGKTIIPSVGARIANKIASQEGAGFSAALEREAAEAFQITAPAAKSTGPGLLSRTATGVRNLASKVKPSNLITNPSKMAGIRSARTTIRNRSIKKLKDLGVSFENAAESTAKTGVVESAPYTPKPRSELTPTPSRVDNASFAKQLEKKFAVMRGDAASSSQTISEMQEAENALRNFRGTSKDFIKKTGASKPYDFDKEAEDLHKKANYILAKNKISYKNVLNRPSAKIPTQAPADIAASTAKTGAPAATPTATPSAKPTAAPSAKPAAAKPAAAKPAAAKSAAPDMRDAEFVEFWTNQFKGTGSEKYVTDAARDVYMAHSRLNAGSSRVRQKQTLEYFQQIIKLARETPPDQNFILPPKEYATGGAVPGIGNSDSVPAMLTPGEFVINKGAAQNIGYGNLERMNAQKFNAGGKVQKFKDGGKVDASIATSQIDVNPDFMSSIRLFNTAVDKLTEAFKVFPHEISMSVSHRVEVIHNGAQVFSEMQPSIRSMIGTTVNDAINKMISEKFPNVGPFQGAGNELGNSGE